MREREAEFALRRILVALDASTLKLPGPADRHDLRP